MIRRPILLILGIPPPYGGGEIRGELVARFFKNKPGYRVFAYARGSGNKSTQGKATGGNLLFGFYYIARCVALLVRFRPRKLFLGLPKNFGAFARAIPVILLGRAMGVKVFGELAGARFLFLDSGWRRAVGLFVLRRLYSIRFLGEHVRDTHAGFRFRCPVVFANGIRLPADRQPGPERGGRTLRLLAVGALNRSKGTGRAIEAVALCRDRGLEVTCTFLGEWSDPKLKAEIQGLIRSRGLERVLQFAGLVTDEGKWPYYRESDVLVQPTEWDGQPLTILEAIGMGLAVISTPVGAIPDTVEEGKNGFLLKENTPERLYEAIRTLYEDRDGLRRMQAYNRLDFNRRFAVERYLDHFEHWIENT